MSDVRTASVDHREPCSKCRKKIKKGDRISIYATAGGCEDDGLVYWMHASCVGGPAMTDDDLIARLREKTPAAWAIGMTEELALAADRIAQLADNEPSLGCPNCGNQSMVCTNCGDLFPTSLLSTIPEQDSTN